MRDHVRRGFLTACVIAFITGPCAAQQPGDITNSITSVSPSLAVAGKLATRTEIAIGRDEPAMVSRHSAAAMDEAIMKYTEIVAGGGWHSIPKGKYQIGVTGPQVVQLRRRLVAEEYLPFDTLNSDAADQFDPDLAQALAYFQADHGIAPTGKMNDRTRAELNITAVARLTTLRENRPRLLAYAEGLGARNILVNIPAAQLEAVENGLVFSRHNVVVGKLDRPTPMLKSKVTDIVFNPYWNAPASIVAKDLIPKYKKDPSIFEQMGIRVLDGPNGREVDPASVDWDNTAADRFVFRQDPGEQNALATMKINFPNKFMVYMHDTPHRELFGSNARYESSGCVRVDQVNKLVEWVLNGQEAINDHEIEMITASRETEAIKVSQAVAPDVRFMYLTAWALPDGTVNFRPDIYQLDGMNFTYGQPQSVEHQ